MKRHRILAFVVIVAGLFCFSGCKKDIEEEKDSKVSYRLLESISSNDSLELYKTIYTYTGDKLTLIENYSSTAKDTSWEYTSKIEITYPDNTTMDKARYDYLNGNWEESSHEIITHQDGRWQEYVKYNPNGTIHLKTNYTYNFNKIIKKETLINNGGSMVHYRTNIFTWIDDLPSTSEYRLFLEDTSTYVIKDTITLSNGKVIKIESIHYFEKGDFDVKREYYYTGENLSSTTLYINDSGSWVEGISDFFYYDGNGNLIKRESDFLKTNYSYEENSGNLSFVEGYLTDFYYMFYPVPTKSGINIPNGINGEMFKNF
ncbi:MAG: hypothetical protein GXO89_02660 [Chlorobi bacterium]|nr:hypothetical protein [Chlorobiota bacterium]